MYFHDQLMKARQDDLLRQMAHQHLVAAARLARRHRRAVTHRSRLLAWAGMNPAAVFPRVSRSEGGAR